MPSPPATLLGNLGPYSFYLPQSGGKAGKGRNKTSSIQVFKDGWIRKHFRFTVANNGALVALANATAWAQAEIDKAVASRELALNDLKRDPGAPS